jgi:hypothetical protein
MYRLPIALLLATVTDKRQTCPLVREGTSHEQYLNSLTATNNWSAAPHQDRLTDRRSQRDFEFDFGHSLLDGNESAQL